MLDEAVLLEPYEEPAGLMEEDGPAVAVPPTHPQILIPGIDADGALYPIEKMEAHVKGLHHLAVSVFVFDGEELLVQRRAEGKYHCGGQWANSCCTHPHWNEDVKDAASRRLREELGFSVPIEERLVVEYSAGVGNGLWEKERVHMFRADVSKDAIEPDLHPDEVSDIRWMTAQALRQDMRTRVADYTPWFRIYLNRYPDLRF